MTMPAALSGWRTNGIGIVLELSVVTPGVLACSYRCLSVRNESGSRLSGSLESPSWLISCFGFRRADIWLSQPPNPER